METRPRSAGSPSHGFTTSYVGRDGVGAHFEAGDAFAFGDALVVGYGPRTEELGLKHLATDLDVRVRGLRITHPGMYHLDLAFCPLDERRAMVCPAAFDDASAAALLALVPEPLVLTEEEALTFCANSVVVGRTILMPACPDRVRAQLEDWGFEVVLLDLGEFHKGGGLGPLPDQPARRGPRPRPAPGGRRRGAAALTRARQSGPALRFAECGPDLVVRFPPGLPSCCCPWCVSLVRCCCPPGSSRCGSPGPPVTGTPRATATTPELPTRQQPLSGPPRASSVWSVLGGLNSWSGCGLGQVRRAPPPRSDRRSATSRPTSRASRPPRARASRRTSCPPTRTRTRRCPAWSRRRRGGGAG